MTNNEFDKNLLENGVSRLQHAALDSPILFVG